MAKRRNKNKKAGPVKIIRPADLNPASVAEASVSVVEQDASEPAAEERVAAAIDESAAAVDESPAAEATDEQQAAEAEAGTSQADAPADETFEAVAEAPAVEEPAPAAETAAETQASEEGAAVEAEASSSEEPASGTSAETTESAPQQHEFEDASALLAQSIAVEPTTGQSTRAIESIPIHDASNDAAGSPSAEPQAEPASRGEQHRGRKADRKLKLNKLQKHARSELDLQPQPEPEPEPAPVVEAEPERRAPSEPRIAAFAKLTEYQTLSLAHVAGLPEETDVPGHWRGVGFGIGGRRFVAGFDEVVEVIRMPQITHVPGTQPWMLGVANVRGTLLPVVDLKQFLEGERTVMYEGQRVMVVRQSGGNVAVLIDQLFGQRAFNDAQKVVADPDAGTRYGHFIKQVYRVGDNDWGVFSMLMLTRTPEFRQAAV